MSPARDFHRDWHRWTTAERLSAVLLGALVATGVSVAVLINAHPF